MKSTTFRDGVPYFGAIGQDIARGMLPIASTFDTSPPNLENITDGDVTTDSGEGSKVLAGAGVVGYISLDFGTPKTGLIMADVSIKSTAGACTGYAEQKIDGVWWTWGEIIAMGSHTTYDRDCHAPVFFANADQIRMMIYVNTAATATIKIHEMIALEVLP